MKQPEFRSLFFGRVQPIRTPYIIWGGWPDTLLTLLLQRALLGIEAYLPAAVWWELGVSGRLDRRLSEQIRQRDVPGRSLVEKLYRGLPGLVDNALSLQRCDGKLWKATVRFYEEVRNPIMHGYEIERGHFDGVARAFEHIADLYSWIDTWHNPDSWIKPGHAKPPSPQASGQADEIVAPDTTRAD
jgi:hypothetical protein